MPVGFESINDNNTVQITDQRYGLSLRRSGAVGNGDFIVHSGGVWLTNIKVAKINLGQSSDFVAPLSFVHATSLGSRCFSILRYQGNDLILEIYCQSGEHVDSVEWFVFDAQGPQAKRTNFGMEIFNENGELRYSSAWYPLRVRNIVNVPADQPPIGGGYYGGGWYDGKVAWATNMQRSHLLINWISVTHNTPIGLCGYIDSNELRISYVAHDIAWKPRTGGPPVYRQNVTAPIMVADVSGLPLWYQ